MHKLMEEKIRLRAEVVVKNSQIAGFERQQAENQERILKLSTQYEEDLLEIARLKLELESLKRNEASNPVKDSQRDK